MPSWPTCFWRSPTALGGASDTTWRTASGWELEDARSARGASARPLVNCLRWRDLAIELRSLCLRNPRPASAARPTERSASELGSGDGRSGGSYRISTGPSNPEISEAFTVAPEVVYSPIVPVPLFATNRSDPETTIPCGKLNPEISEAFTVAPRWCIRRRCRQEGSRQIDAIRDRDAARTAQSRDQRGVHRYARSGIFTNRAGVKVRDKEI